MSFRASRCIELSDSSYEDEDNSPKNRVDCDQKMAGYDSDGFIEAENELTIPKVLKHHETDKNANPPIFTAPIQDSQLRRGTRIRTSRKPLPCIDIPEQYENQNEVGFSKRHIDYIVVAYHRLPSSYPHGVFRYRGALNQRPLYQIPFCMLEGLGPPSPTLGHPGDVFYEFCREINLGVNPPCMIYVRMLQGWKEKRRSNPIMHPLLPGFVIDTTITPQKNAQGGRSIWTTWRFSKRTASTHCPSPTTDVRASALDMPLPNGTSQKRRVDEDDQNNEPSRVLSQKRMKLTDELMHPATFGASKEIDVVTISSCVTTPPVIPSQSPTTVKLEHIENSVSCLAKNQNNKKSREELQSEARFKELEKKYMKLRREYTTLQASQSSMEAINTSLLDKKTFLTDALELSRRTYSMSQKKCESLEQEVQKLKEELELTRSSPTTQVATPARAGDCHGYDKMEETPSISGQMMGDLVHHMPLSDDRKAVVASLESILLVVNKLECKISEDAKHITRLTTEHDAVITTQTEHHDQVKQLTLERDKAMKEASTSQHQFTALRQTLLNLGNG